MAQQTIFRTRNGQPYPITDPAPSVPRGQRSLPLHARAADPMPEAPPPPGSALDAAAQLREMSDLVTAFAKGYGYHLPPKAAMETARIIVRTEHRYSFGEFDDEP